MKLSIIIPVFNTAKFLKKCIDSCINQNIPIHEYEIILINDGSTDESSILCQDFIKKYYNIKYIYQENQGQSVARNQGLELSQGDYIWFVDSDDFIEENCLKNILSLCYDNDLEILKISYELITEGFNKTLFNANRSANFFITNGSEILKTNFVFGPPIYLYKRKYLELNNLSFYPKIFHEDNEFTPKALYFANKIGIIDSVFYYIYLRSGSTTRSINSKKCFDLLIVCNSLINFSKNIDRKIVPYICNVIGSCLNSALYSSINISILEKNKLNDELKKNRHIFNYMIKSKNIFYKIEGMLFKLFPTQVFKIYNILKKIK